MKRYFIIFLVLTAVFHSSVAMAGDREETPFLSFKTNLLYWTGVMPDFHYYTPVPNLEAEWFFLRNWSLSGIGNYARWGYGDGEFFGISSWSLEPRWWACAPGRYRWFFLGVYGEGGDFDVRDRSVSEEDYTGRFWSGGLSAGVVIPFNRHWGMELAVRGGFRRSLVNTYVIEDKVPYLEKRGNADHWGVTGLKCSLYYRFALRSKRRTEK